MLPLFGIQFRIIVNKVDSGLKAPAVVRLSACVLFQQVDRLFLRQILSSDTQNLFQFFDKADLLPCLALSLAVVEIGAARPELRPSPLGKLDDLLSFFLPLHGNSTENIRFPYDRQGLLPVIVHAGLQRGQIISHPVRFLLVIPAQIPGELVYEGSLVVLCAKDDLRAHPAVEMEDELPRTGQGNPHGGISVK